MGLSKSDKQSNHDPSFSRICGKQGFIPLADMLDRNVRTARICIFDPNRLAHIDMVFVCRLMHQIAFHSLFINHFLHIVTFNKNWCRHIFFIQYFPPIEPFPSSQDYRFNFLFRFVCHAFSIIIFHKISTSCLKNP